MNDIISLIRDAIKTKRARIALALFLAIPLIWFFIVQLIKAPELPVKNTGLTVQNNLAVIHDTMYLYNGLGFYTMNTSSNTPPKLLYAPKERLPEVSSIQWSSHGALLNFQSGIMYTMVDDYIRDNAIDFTTNDYFTWYVDFEDKSIHFVEQANIKNNLAIYSEKLDGFYYIPNIKYSDLNPNTSELRFYHPKTKRVTTVAKQMNFDIQTIISCPYTEHGICLIGRDASTPYGKTSLYTLTKNGTFSTITSIDGEIFPTANDTEFILLSGRKPYQEVNTMYSRISLFNAKTQSRKEYSGTVFSGTIAAGIINHTPYIVDGENNEYLSLHDGTFGTSTRIGKLSLDHGITVLPSRASGSSVTLVSSDNGTIYALGDTPQTFTKKTADAISKMITSCIDDSHTSFTQAGDLFTLYINDDESFTKTLSTVKQCLAKDAKDFYGYRFTFRGVSPINGRITTD